MNMRGMDTLQRTARRVMNLFVPRAIILLYHRVTDLPLDPQLLCVTPQHFAEHLQVIREHRAVQLSALGDALEPEQRGECPVIVTFDDGYADNLYNAKPLLEYANVPATVFVTAGYVGCQREFWYDDLERVLLHAGRLPETLRLSIGTRSYEWHLGSDTDCKDAFNNNDRWNVTRKNYPTARHKAYCMLCEILRPLADGARQPVLEYLSAWAGMDTNHRPTHRTLLPKELIQLAAGGLIEIGSHTVSHPVLSALSSDAQAEEISQSKVLLEEILGCAVTTFAYPFGGRLHYTEQTVAAVREAGFQWACANFAGTVRADTDRWQLPRFLVRDCDGDQFARDLEEWINA